MSFYRVFNYRGKTISLDDTVSEISSRQDEYDVYFDNYTEYLRILYIQRNYNKADLFRRQEIINQTLSRMDQLQRQIIDNPESGRSVVFQEMKDTGLGNNLLALASSFIVSTLLNASFQDATADSTYSKWKIRWSGCKPKTKSLETQSLSELVPKQKLVITAFYDYTKHLLKTSRYDKYLEANGLVPPFDFSSHLWRTNDSMVRLQRSFYTEFSLMTAVRLFFRPKVHLQMRIEETVQSWGQYHLIGMQIRMGSGGADFTDSHKFLQMASLSLFVLQAEQYRIKRGYSEDEVKWFISTDSSEVERNLMKSYPERIVVDKNYRRGHSSKQYDNKEGFYRAVIDIALLSNCEYLVLTNYSSFGMIARMVSPKSLFTIIPANGY